MIRTPLSIHLRLVLLSAGVTAAVVAVAFFALRTRVETNVRDQFGAELQASQRALSGQQDRNKRVLLATSSLVSTSPRLRAPMETWRYESGAGLPTRPDLLATIQREVEDMFVDLGHELLVVADEEGSVLAVASRGGQPQLPANLLNLPSVRHALGADTVSADSSFGVLRYSDGNHDMQVQIGSVAIIVSGYPIGVLVVGERLDRLMPQLADAPGTRSIVTVGDQVALSNLTGASVGSTWRAPEQNRESTWRTRLGNDDFVGTTLPLGLAENGQPAHMHLMRSLTASIGPLTGTLGRSFLWVGILAVLIAGAGAALVSRASLQPLARFVGFMRAGASTGAYARYTEPTAAPEIATLTDAYNSLIDSLGSQHEQLRASQEQLRQSQKLEAIGTLAGGVAHDFNNLLSVIMGYTHLTMDELPADHPTRADLENIMQASERAHGLVRQLLAFSRKQVLQPQILDLNLVMNDLKSLLKPLIGEDVLLRFELAPRVSPIMADRGQIEQVIVNLVVNARDAMPTGGTITFETADVRLDDRYAEVPDTIPGGPAVMLSVTDTGKGMDAIVRDRIFEPFFTTKEPGKGTGLGLSTVYGIVKQSGGNLRVYSEPGVGTTFRIFFPATAESAQSADIDQPADVTRGNETVLLAEDDAQVRALVRRCLVSRGYEVLEARDGQEAVEVAAQHDGQIHLLLTDVVMPRLSGRELAGRLVKIRPDVRVLFMSGHSEEAVARHGVLADGAPFIQKPVLPDVLGRTVREILDAEPARSV